MKNSILLILVVIASKFTYAQNCKYEKNETDNFTGKSIKMTSKSVVFADPFDPQNKSMFFRFNEVDSINFLSVSNWYTSIISVKKMDNLMIKFTSGEILKLESLEYKVATPYSSKWHIDIDYSLTKENLKKIQENLISEVRIYTNSGYVDYVVKEKNASKIMSSSNCIK